MEIRKLLFTFPKDCRQSLNRLRELEEAVESFAKK